MPIVPTLILWSIAWLMPAGINGEPVPPGELAASCQHIEVLTSSTSTLDLAIFSIAEVPSFADLGATQIEEDDLFEALALDFGLYPQEADRGRTGTVKHFLPHCDRAESIGRLFALRC